MAKKLPNINAPQAGGPPLPRALQDVAQQIWLAGLGAFSQAQAQGGKAFETLVKEGLALQCSARTPAQGKIADASPVQTGDPQNKLESIFEHRVAKALSRLGTPGAADMNALLARLDQLDKRVQQMDAASAATPATPSAPQTRLSATAPTPAKNIAKPAARQKAASPTAPPSPDPTSLDAANSAASKRLKTSPSS